jgi:LAO/AO transport system kinase
MMVKDPQIYVQGVLEGNRRMMSKTITLIESALPAHQALAQAIVDELLPHTGRGVRLGITGVPGVGKSAFIERLGVMLVEKGHRVAVLAVDPSSSRSGGSVLADKTRMERLATEDRAYIRPSPSGGSLGGVARKTREAVLVCEAAGYDIVIIETVGVGQSEITVKSMVDFFLVLMLAGAGDELQGIKKGILELADAIAINKADGDNIEKADAARAEYEKAVHLLRPASPTWVTPVLTCSAVTRAGINDIWEAVLKHHTLYTKTGELEKLRNQQALEWVRALVEETLMRRFYENPDVAKRLPGLLQDVERGAMTPTSAANRLIAQMDEGHA